MPKILLHIGLLLPNIIAKELKKCPKQFDKSPNLVTLEATDKNTFTRRPIIRKNIFMRNTFGNDYIGRQSQNIKETKTGKWSEVKVEKTAEMIRLRVCVWSTFVASGNWNVN